MTTQGVCSRCGDIGTLYKGGFCPVCSLARRQPARNPLKQAHCRECGTPFRVPIKSKRSYCEPCLNMVRTANSRARKSKYPETRVCGFPGCSKTVDQTLTGNHGRPKMYCPPHRFMGRTTHAFKEAATRLQAVHRYADAASAAPPLSEAE